MLKLALCDDDKTFLKEFSDHIEAWMLDQGEHPLVCSFSSPSALTASVADGERFDLFVLDVEMPGMDGLETAKESVKGLTSGAGFIRRELGSRLAMRRSPELRFIADNSIEHGAQIAKKLGELLD